VTIPASYAFYYALKWRGLPDLRTLESFPVAISKIFMSLVFYEITFYINHTLLHHKLIYKHIHKIHHEWISSVSIIALYAHPVEHLVINLGSVWGAVVFTNSHIATGWVWMGLLLISTLVDHSGYHVPFTHSSQHHDYHHLK
jgi:fatty acid hydroxylase domain-containing protein 2